MDWKKIVMSIKKSCQVTIDCNDRIMEKEFKGGTQRLPNNFFLYLDSSDFSRHGNTLRKRYNIIYAVLMVYSIVLFIFMRASG